MTRKTTDAYKEVFEVLKEKLGGNVSPATMMTDFEQASIKASHAVFPKTAQNGCFFHFTQALYRHIRLNFPELRELCNKDYEVNHHIKRICALAFVPSKDVKATFKEFKDSDFFNDFDEIDGFMRYFKSTWIFWQKKIVIILKYVYQGK
ncbi:hypothetical protein DMENIID0001_144900 [Sergentomyia squamirostris]